MLLKASDVYLRHFTRFLGKPFDVEMFRGEDGVGVRLATFDQRFPKFKVYASLGLSDAQDKVSDLGELILLTDDFRPDVKRLFTHFLLFMLQEEIPLGSRFCIGGIEMLNPDFAEHYEKEGLYVMPAEGFDEGFTELDCLGETGRVYQALFLSFNELDYLRRHGGVSLEEKLRRLSQNEIELCALSRPSCA